MRPEDHEMELEPAGPNPEDACPVCDKIDCVCPPEPEPTSGLTDWQYEDLRLCNEALEDLEDQR